MPRNILTNTVASGDPKRVQEVQVTVGDPKVYPITQAATGQGVIDIQIVTGRDPKRVLQYQ